MNIWQALKKPILILAPMEDVTDTVFRRIIIECGRPDLFLTEFTNVDGMASEGDEVVSQRLRFDPVEKPIIAQIWGKDPKHFYQAAQRIVSLGFDGIDINMGCPEKAVVKNGCCAALINNRSLAHEIILATQQGATTAGNTIPVSVKTRIGYASIVTEDWISFLLSHRLNALIVHGRTAKEMSEVPAHWEEIAKAVSLRNTISPETVIIGNGDVITREEALEKVDSYSVDGVMIGRGVFKNPFVFRQTEHSETAKPQQMFELLERHLKLWQEIWGEQKHYPVLKKYFKIYISGFDGASEVREKLMETKTPEEAISFLKQISSQQ